MSVQQSGVGRNQVADTDQIAVHLPIHRRCDFGPTDIKGRTIGHGLGRLQRRSGFGQITGNLVIVFAGHGIGYHQLVCPGQFGSQPRDAGFDHGHLALGFLQHALVRPRIDEKQRDRPS